IKVGNYPISSESCGRRDESRLQDDGNGFAGDAINRVYKMTGMSVQETQKRVPLKTAGMELSSGRKRGEFRLYFEKLFTVLRIAVRFVSSLSRNWISSILAPSLFALAGSKWVSMNIP